MSIEAQLKGLPACAVPSKRTRASLRFDGYGTDTRFVPRVREGGRHARGRRVPPVQAAPVEATKAEGERGGPLPFSHDLAYAAFGAGRGRDATRSSRASDEEVGSRTPSQSIVVH